MEEFVDWYITLWYRPSRKPPSKTTPPYIELQTYPFELLSHPEATLSTAILTGHVPPYSSGPCTLDKTVIAFAKDRRLKGDKVVFVHRGAMKEADRDLVALANTLCELDGVSVICQRNHDLVDNTSKDIYSKQIMLARGILTHSEIFPKVDLVVHHGK